MYKKLNEIENGWFIRDEETELSLEFDSSCQSLSLIVYFNGFIPINSNIKFKASATALWFDFTIDATGESKPRFRGVMVCENVLGAEIYPRSNYDSRVGAIESIYVGVHEAEDEQGRKKIVLVGDLSVLEVQCHAVKFHASQIFD